MQSRGTPDHPLERVTVLELDQGGSIIDPESRKPIKPAALPSFLRNALAVRQGVTDIFVWAHGWRNDQQTAIRAANQLFGGIERRYAQHKDRYQQIRSFKGQHIVICWPSHSSVLPSGYAKIRERSHQMTTQGYAEYSLAQLLGYLDHQRVTPSRAPGSLQTHGGQYLHCIGHSFGGRFLAQAINAAATPSPPTLALLPPNQKFAFTVDSFLVFQMAARLDIFTTQLRSVLIDAPLQGPICLTFSSADRATCRWHRLAEGTPGIGCHGATAAPGDVITTRLHPVSQDYRKAELMARIVNIDASWRYRRGRLLNPSGAHSDIQHEESYHLLLTLVNFARP
jgi:hypothetical protein